MFRGVLVDFIDPLTGMMKGLFISDIVDNNYSMGTTIEVCCNGSETLLTSSIPKLEFDDCPIDMYGFHLEVDSNGGHILLAVRVICKAVQERGLSYSRITNEQRLEHVVILSI